MKVCCSSVKRSHTHIALVCEYAKFDVIVEEKGMSNPSEHKMQACAVKGKCVVVVSHIRSSQKI